MFFILSTRLVKINYMKNGIQLITKKRFPQFKQFVEKILFLIKNVKSYILSLRNNHNMISNLIFKFKL